MLKSKISKQFQYISNLKKFSQFRLVSSSILKNQFLNVYNRSLVYSYNNSKLKYFPTYYKISCIVTGRSRAVISNLNISRLTFKKYSMQGDLPGFKRSRW
jgi:ribosomal protein S14